MSTAVLRGVAGDAVQARRDADLVEAPVERMAGEPPAEVEFVRTDKGRRV